MNCNNHSVIGTTFKLNVHMEPMDGHHMSEVDWVIEVHCSNLLAKSFTVPKDKAKMVDDDNYIIVIDTNILGAGLYSLTFTAWIPDTHCDGGLRTEIINVCTGVRITR